MLRSVAAFAAAATLTVGALTMAAPVGQAVPMPAQISAPTLMLPTSVTYKFANCTALNKVYKHGVGKSTARDKTSGKPVTTFKHSTSLYKKVIGYRKGLDRDKDGIACEKR